MFLVLAPGTVAVAIPWWICRWRVSALFLGFVWFRVIGLVFVAAGLAVLLDSFARFAVRGLGTPAPAMPTEHLVISGLYRYVRNPMYVAITAMILGQALFFGSVQLLVYGAAVWSACHVFVRLYEEPALHKRFGAEYDDFRAHVPRWIPRTKPWRGRPW